MSIGRSAALSGRSPHGRVQGREKHQHLEYHFPVISPRESNVITDQRSLGMFKVQETSS